MATRTEIIAAGMLSALLIFTAFAVVRLLSNGPPVADASDAPTVFAGYLAELDGAGSTDPDGDELTYEWTMQSRPEDSAIELVTPDMATVSFTPDIPGEYVVSLAVSDGELASPPAQVVVVARPWLTDVTDEAGGPGGRRQDFTDGLGPGAAWGDYDGDGDTDIYVVNANGRNALYRNEIGSRMNWIGIRLLGTASNLKGIGAKVEVTSRDGVTRTLSPAGGSGYLGQNDTDVLFGLGAADRVDIRVTWPNGVVQDFWDVWANTLGRVRESTMEGSCPLVFAWDGSDYSFVSDVMGSAVTGFALAPDVYRFPIDTDKYLKIEGLEPREGSYSIRIVELLNEIIYLDKAILLVVDHPSDLTAFPNERLHLFPPFPEARMYLAGGLRPPVAALDQEGNDILYLISARDGVYFEPNAYLPYEGFAEEYSIVLDLGDLSNLEVILLVLNGWTHYVTSYGLHQASQAGVGPMLPRLDVVDEEGEWTPVAMDMGFPGGQPKTMTYNLTGRFPTDDYRARITTNLQLFWDQIFVGSNPGEVTPRITELTVAAAGLHWKGYPKLLQATGDRRMRPAAHDYAWYRPTGTAGPFPREGTQSTGTLLPCWTCPTICS